MQFVQILCKVIILYLYKCCKNELHFTLFVQIYLISYNFTNLQTNLQKIFATFILIFANLQANYAKIIGSPQRGSHCAVIGGKVMNDYQWQNKDQSHKLNKIMDALKDYLIETENYIVIPDNYKELIDKNLLVGLGKEFYLYKNHYQKSIILKSRFDTYCKQKEEERQAKVEKIKKQQEQLEVVEGLKQEYGKQWRDRGWIEANIGKYYNWEPLYEYFWTLIGDNWQVADWKHNIKIEENVHKKIAGIKVNGISGSTFLGRKFQNQKHYSTGIIGTYIIQRKPNHYGVYGIYADEELIYIGSTIRDFSERFKEHKDNVLQGDNSLSVYNIIRNKKDQGANIAISILIDCAELKVNKVLTIEDVESMELALIHLYQPIGNIAGIKTEFKYHGY